MWLRCDHTRRGPTALAANRATRRARDREAVCPVVGLHTVGRVAELHLHLGLAHSSSGVVTQREGLVAHHGYRRCRPRDLIDRITSTLYRDGKRASRRYAHPPRNTRPQRTYPWCDGRSASGAVPPRSNANGYDAQGGTSPPDQTASRIHRGREPNAKHAGASARRLEDERVSRTRDERNRAGLSVDPSKSGSKPSGVTRSRWTRRHSDGYNGAWLRRGRACPKPRSRLGI
jgi:hypothetical protein